MITYCTNIHPGESWDEVLANLNTCLPEVKKAVSPDRSFPVGMRLSNHASREISEEASSRFKDWCQQHDYYVSTINGFPFGTFHSLTVKENVYLPDWRHPERAEYTKRLARLLDAWMPPGRTGSISTVPIGFRRHTGRGDYGLIRNNLTGTLEYLDGLKQRSGKEIILSLEPEPGCLLETAADVVEFFEEMRFPDELSSAIGVCYDCCHHAVEFEGPLESLARLSDCGIKIGKLQVSAALSILHRQRGALDKFTEPRYLHQVVIRRRDGALARYDDLPEALSDYNSETDDEWRVHFHVPVFFEGTDTYATTKSFTEKVISIIDKDILLEVETYTYDVLPQELRMRTVTELIIREIQWVQEQLKAQRA